MNRREVAALAGLAAASACARGIGGLRTGEALPLAPPPMPSAPLDPRKALNRIGFGSCYAPQFEKAQIWDAILATSPDAFLCLGDNVYQSEENGRPELLELRAAYAALAADRSFAALRAATPLLVTWDDHDYGMNDAGAEFSARTQSEALFKQVWAVDEADPRAQREGVYYERTVGESGQRTQIIMLDARYFRTSATMLGAAQWRWLEETLGRPADIRILASSIPVLSEADDGETWSECSHERDRLLALLDRAGGAVVVSGDSHFGAHYERRSGLSRPLKELTSSSLNFPMPREHWRSPGPQDSARLGPAYYGANFGILNIDWRQREVGLALHADDGRMVSAERSSFS